MDRRPRLASPARLCGARELQVDWLLRRARIDQLKLRASGRFAAPQRINHHGCRQHRRGKPAEHVFHPGCETQRIHALCQAQFAALAAAENQLRAVVSVALIDGPLVG
jgi:hypothetical protein